MESRPGKNRGKAKINDFPRRELAVKMRRQRSHSLGAALEQPSSMPAPRIYVEAAQQSQSMERHRNSVALARALLRDYPTLARLAIRTDQLMVLGLLHWTQSEGLKTATIT